MTLVTHAENNQGSSPQFHYDYDPDTCPICHAHVAPKRITATISEDESGGRLQIVFRCSRRVFDNLFIGIYNQPKPGAEYTLVKLTPMAPQEEPFSDLIRGLSPSFVQIYNQAIAAESLELDQISGIGFRKALEFLIKDFAIKQRPTDEELIKKSFLGTVIKDHIDDARLRSAAERATWLGNDETHYVRKWIDKDVADLKILIKLSVNWIENVLLNEKYAKDMT
ncbi:MAG: DUF4145 domain-containing protein [Acidobacteria bacterium]|nr:DUF4145 domain-containing protein [Acidobacteriota bacterium]